MSKTKTMCMFCGRGHRGKTPKLCKNKGKILSKYVSQNDIWRVFQAVENGEIDLDGEATRLFKRR